VPDTPARPIARLTCKPRAKLIVAITQCVIDRARVPDPATEAGRRQILPALRRLAVRRAQSLYCAGWLSEIHLGLEV